MVTAKLRSFTVLLVLHWRARSFLVTVSYFLSRNFNCGYGFGVGVLIGVIVVMISSFWFWSPRYSFLGMYLSLAMDSTHSVCSASDMRKNGSMTDFSCSGSTLHLWHYWKPLLFLRNFLNPSYCFKVSIYSSVEVVSTLSGRRISLRVMMA